MADPDGFLAAAYGPAEPVMLVPEKLRVKVGDSPGQNLKDVPILLADRVEYALDMLILAGEGYKHIELLGDPLEHEEVLGGLVVVVGVEGEGGDLDEAGEGVVAEVVGVEHEDQLVDHVGVDDVVHGDPGEEGAEGFEAGAHEGGLGLVRVLQDQFAQLEHRGEVLVHAALELCDLLLRELALGVVEDLLRQHLQNAQVVLADVHVVD